jgi:hypothetical protein
MKTIFTLLLIIIISISSNAQKATSVNQNNGTFISGIIPANRTFRITKTYPNPVTDNVTIEFQSEVTGTIEVRLFNILGTEIKKWNPLFLPQDDQKLNIDLSTFKTGVYILKISTSDQTCSTVVKKN